MWSKKFTVTSSLHTNVAVNTCNLYTHSRCRFFQMSCGKRSIPCQCYLFSIHMLLQTHEICMLTHILQILKEILSSKLSILLVLPVLSTHALLWTPVICTLTQAAGSPIGSVVKHLLSATCSLHTYVTVNTCNLYTHPSCRLSHWFCGQTSPPCYHFSPQTCCCKHLLSVH